MTKTQPIKKNYEFRRAYNKGKTSPGSLVVIYSLKNRRGANRLGLTVSKKIGNAVSRNRARRLMRESYRLLEPQIKGGLDLVMVARTKCVYSNLHAVMAQMENSLRSLGAMDE